MTPVSITIHRGYLVFFAPSSQSGPTPYEYLEVMARKPANRRPVPEVLRLAICSNDYNHHDSVQALLIEKIGH